MGEIREVKLPGVGVRYEFETADGTRIGVVSHRSGLREVYASRPGDRDAFTRVLGLSADNARTLAELLGATRVSQQLAELQQRVEGLVIDWLPVRGDSPFAGRPIGDTQMRARTGVSVVAIVRGEEAVPAPGPDVPIEDGDFLVVVGTARGVEAAVSLLRLG
jgi:TrkA domain protein